LGETEKIIGLALAVISALVALVTWLIKRKNGHGEALDLHRLNEHYKMGHAHGNAIQAHDYRILALEKAQEDQENRLRLLEARSKR